MFDLKKIWGCHREKMVVQLDVNFFKDMYFTIQW